MSTAATADHGRMVRLLHWTSAAAIVAAFLLGLGMEAAPRGPTRTMLREAHYLAGLTALALGGGRIAWRLVAAAWARGGAQAAGWSARAARLAHWALLALGLAVPLTGLFDRWARGRPVPLPGGWDFAAPFPIPGGRIWGEMHETLAWSLALLVGLHLLAVAWHALVLRDGTLRRMLGRGTERAA